MSTLYTPEMKVCAFCHEQFVPRHGSQKYCKHDCYLAANILKSRANYRSKHPVAEPSADKPVSMANAREPSVARSVMENFILQYFPERMLTLETQLNDVSIKLDKILTHLGLNNVRQSLS